LATLSRLSLFLLVGLIGLKVALAFEGIDFNIVYIAAVAALPVLLGRRGIITGIDWRTLVFFLAMFVLMEAVWLEAGDSLTRYVTTDTAAILLLSTAASQLVSNVPFVALGIPPLLSAGGGARELVALAAGSTVAGLLFILGAASNVIIIQQAEARGETLTLGEFARVGIPLTAVCLTVFWLFLR
ncbi:MAG: SLC13 family permease, partial [Thermoanaerobaculia bacterium]